MIMLSFVADQRTDLQQEVNELKQTLASNDKGRKELIDSSKRLKDQLNQAVVSPPWPGYTRPAGFSLHLFLLAVFTECQAVGFAKAVGLEERKWSQLHE